MLDLILTGCSFLILVVVICSAFTIFSKIKNKELKDWLKKKEGKRDFKYFVFLIVIGLILVLTFGFPSCSSSHSSSDKDFESKYGMTTKEFTPYSKTFNNALGK